MIINDSLGDNASGRLNGISEILLIMRRRKERRGEIWRCDPLYGYDSDSTTAIREKIEGRKDAEINEWKKKERKTIKIHNIACEGNLKRVHHLKKVTYEKA